MSVVDRTSSEFQEYLQLYERATLLELGQLADAERWRQRHVARRSVCNVAQLLAPVL